MRLIDADELKECLDWCEVCRLSIKEIKEDYIDTAPTVEQYCYITGAQWDEFIAEFMEKHKRPHGKWNREYGEVHRGYGFYICSNCDTYNTRITNFCPNCGADMRGDNNE